MIADGVAGEVEVEQLQGGRASGRQRTAGRAVGTRPAAVRHEHVNGRSGEVVAGGVEALQPAPRGEHALREDVDRTIRQAVVADVQLQDVRAAAQDLLHRGWPSATVCFSMRRAHAAGLPHARMQCPGKQTDCTLRWLAMAPAGKEGLGQRAKMGRYKESMGEDRKHTKSTWAAGHESV